MWNVVKIPRERQMFKMLIIGYFLKNEVKNGFVFLKMTENDRRKDKKHWKWRDWKLAVVI